VGFGGGFSSVRTAYLRRPERKSEGKKEAKWVPEQGINPGGRLLKSSLGG